MILITVALMALGYFLIGLLFSALWIKEAIKNAGRDFDSIAYTFKCGISWPWLIFNKEDR